MHAKLDDVDGVITLEVFDLLYLFMSYVIKLVHNICIIVHFVAQVVNIERLLRVFIGFSVNEKLATKNFPFYGIFLDFMEENGGIVDIFDCIGCSWIIFYLL